MQIIRVNSHVDLLKCCYCEDSKNLEDNIPEHLQSRINEQLFLCTCLEVAIELPDRANKNKEFLVKFEFLINNEYFFG